MTPSGAQIPLGEVAKVELSPGPSMIRDEDAQLTGYVYIDLSTSHYGSYVDRAQSVLDQKLRLPSAACSFNTGWDSISASQHGSGTSRCSGSRSKPES